MSGSETISREDWLAEMESTSPSTMAFDAYVGLEEFLVDEGVLTCTYRRNLGGQSHFATFCGSAAGRCSVVQIYNGQCTLNWKWKTPIPGLTAEQQDLINQSFEKLRKSLDGSPNKGWEQIKVLSLGLDRVKTALQAVSEELIAIIGSATEEQT